ncbi:MAG: TonB-dependent receptor [Acidobacteria bacterium]|nr:TonB-dependent receptor [Acidobacteriota bacterium]
MKRQIAIATGVLLCSVIWAHADTAILGTVSDPSGSVLPGVSVTARNVETNYSRNAVTDERGAYRIAALPVGNYELSAELAGFQTLVRSGIKLEVEQQARIDLVLQVGSVSETVQVVSDAPLVDTQTATVGQLINNKQIVDLPLNGRSFIQLASLGTGVAVSAGGGTSPGAPQFGSQNFSTNGQRSHSNNFILDGSDNNNTYSGFMSVLPSIDSIQEFRIETNNYGAEYGGRGGAVITLVSKSGTNSLHGTLFEFLRNSSLDAKNFFDRHDAPIPPFKLNQFGANLGGPIRKDKTFFFGSYEGSRQRTAITRIANVPSLDQRRGVFNVTVVNTDGSTSKQTVTVPVHAVSAKLFQLYPLPNVSSPSGNFISSPGSARDGDSYQIKIDHIISASDSLLGRYSISQGDVIDPFPTGQGFPTIPGFGMVAEDRNQALTLSHTHVFSPHIVNELRFGFVRTHYLRVGEDGPRLKDFGFNINNSSALNADLIPSITIGGTSGLAGSYSNLGTSATLPHQSNSDTFQVFDNLSWTKGRHSMKMGGDIRRYRVNRFYPVSQSGLLGFTGARNGEFDSKLRLAFDPMLDFALGLPTSAFSFAGNAARGFRTTAFSTYFQDNIQAASNLTVNLGLRYEYTTVISETGKRLMVWRPDMVNTPTLGLFVIGDNTASCVVTPCSSLPGLEHPYDPQRLNFAPRVGFAYSPLGNNKTVIRGGYGIFWDVATGYWMGNIMLGPPFLSALFNLFPAFPDSFGPGKSFGGRSNFPSLPQFTTFAKDFQFPYIQQWDVSIQRALTNNLTFEIAYVGTKGTHLTFNANNNQPITDPKILGRELTLADSATRDARRPYKGIGTTNYFEGGDNSSYNSMQLKLTQRLTSGTTYIVSYTWSKSIDYKSELEGSLASNKNVKPQDNFNRRAERGVSDFDLTHRFAISYVVDLPFRRLFSGLPVGLTGGWQLSGITTLQTGSPFSIFTGTDRSLTGTSLDRPDLVGDPHAGSRSVGQWFNTKAFALNAIGKFGNSGRNILRSPAYYNFDVALSKTTPVWREHSLQFRAEFFNLFNRPHFSVPSNTMASPNFGALYVTSDVASGNVGLGSGGPRLIQLGLKYIF